MLLLCTARKKKEKYCLRKLIILMEDRTSSDLKSCLVETEGIVSEAILMFEYIYSHILILLALAFCDFDKLQKMRRRIMQAHTFPTAGGQLWQKLDEVRIKMYRNQVLINFA